MMNSSVSVIIPAYNRASLIGETLKSVLSQSVKPIEVIVVDDGSIDETAKVAASFDSRVRVISQKNQGAGAARNRGFAEATGEFIHFMDSDDIVSLNTYECQLNALRSSGADVAYGPWVKTRFDNNCCKTHPVVIQQAPLPASIPMHEWILRGWVTVFQPCLFRRSILEKAGPYREDLKPSEDTEYLYRIGKAGAKLVHTPDTLVIYRVHPEGQVSVSNSAARQKDWLRFLSVMDAHCSSDISITARSKWLFNFRKLEALKYIDPSIAADTEVDLRSNISASTVFTHALTSGFRRFQGRIRRSRLGDNYSHAFGTGRITDLQKQLFSELGYSHSGFCAN
jgi:glycosyltransferase involved in cell wall biosynthesis